MNGPHAHEHAKRRACMNSSASESTTARYLLAAYCVFIIYGCFIPFHFNFDPNFVRWRWLVFLTESLHEDIARPSLSDIVSNILLFVPFGILSVWARAAGSTDRARFFPILCTTLYGLLFDRYRVRSNCCAWKGSVNPRCLVQRNGCFHRCRLG